MKRVLLLWVLALFSFSAVADEASHRQAAEEMLQASRADQMFDAVMPQMMAMYQQMVGEMDVPEEKRAVVERYFQRAAEMMAEMWRWEKIKPDMVDLYVSVYSEQELRDITAFYHTPAGQALLDKMPQLMQATMQYTQGQMREMLPALQQLAEEMQGELRQ